ncbi:MAG: alanine--glyoxylate aminotransferase family protein, partial [Gammaproteobacteria bacterium]|nr:alanine--glyoxylate aminotransferase family protein [Gammaproteobacteria bacterium]
AVMVDDAWGDPVDPEKVEDALKANPDAKILAFVHAETSTGALSDAKTLCALADQYDCLSLVDAVTSFGGSELRVDDWGIDAIYSGSQKCLSCLPGISPVSFSQKAVDVIANRKTPVQSWFLDMSLIMGYWGHSNSTGGKRSYHHTAPVNALYALHESLVMLHEEGLDNAWQRHRDMHMLLRSGLEDLGFEYIGQDGARLNQLNAVKVPAGVDEAQMRSRLLNEYNLEIGGGLGALAGKVVRIGLMGYAAKKENVTLCLAALRDVLGK